VEPIHVIEDIWVALGIVWLLAALRLKPAQKKESSAERALYALVMMLAFWLMVDARIRIGFLGDRFVPSAGYPGLAMVFAGAAFAAWARIYMGANWSGRVAIKQDQQLIRSGPYAIVRHPIYAGLLLAVLGTAVAIGEVGCLIAFGLAVAGWRMKWRREEQFLSEHFGAQYDDYRRHVKALIPFVY